MASLWLGDIVFREFVQAGTPCRDVEVKQPAAVAAETLARFACTSLCNEARFIATGTTTVSRAPWASPGIHTQSHCFPALPTSASQMSLSSRGPSVDGHDVVLPWRRRRCRSAGSAARVQFCLEIFAILKNFDAGRARCARPAGHRTVRDAAGRRHDIGVARVNCRSARR